MKSIVKHLSRYVRAALCVALGVAAFVPAPALAESVDVPSEEELAVYEAEGTLEKRIAYQQSLLTAEPSDELFELMEDAGIVSQFDTQGTLPRTGSARILAVRVAFPAGDGEDAMGFDEDDTLEALDALVDGNANEFPYESLSAYYKRSSLGKLTISGDAFDYTAAYPRSHYDQDTGLLFREILEAFDAEIDFRDYDGNDDGIIDCIVVRFAGETTGWGTAWWSSETLLDFSGEGEETPTFDGLLAGSRILLHEPSNDSETVRTLIHESGHALGLPDYYQAPDTAASKSGGILTSDMMCNNFGEQNGFSKWVLGWLDDSQVTWVTVTEDGVLATKGGQSVGTLTDDGLQLDLAPFTSDEPGETGGIIVVADHACNKYSSYYVLQYDVFAGNQSLFWGIDEWKPLSSGFRLYRVQAGLDEWGDLRVTNFDGTINNQLIELVDPDGGLDHYSDPENNVTLTAEDGERWGCMYYAGDSVSPSTSPSTNFYETASAGWSGIAIDFTRSDADGGTIVVRYDASQKPGDESPQVSCPEGTELVRGEPLTLVADRDVTFAHEPYVCVRLDGEHTYPCTSIETYGSAIVLNCGIIDTDILAAATKAEVVFEEGAFLLYGGAVSPEIVVAVPIGGIELSYSGNLNGGSYLPPFVSLTEIFEDEAGTRYFYTCDSDAPYRAGLTYCKYTIDANDPTKVTKSTVEGEEAEKVGQLFIYKSALSELSPSDVVGYLVPEGADLGDYKRLLDAVEVDGRIYVLSQTWDGGEKLLSVFEKDGTPLGSVTTPSSEHNYGLVRVSSAGVVAVTVYAPFTSDTMAQVTYFYDKDLNYIDVLSTNGTGCVQWLSDGRFATYGWRYNVEFAPGATLEEPAYMLSCDITVPLGEAKAEPEPEKPDTPATPEKPDMSDTSGVPEKQVATELAAAAAPEKQTASQPAQTIPATGDAGLPAAALLAALGVCLLLLAARADKNLA